MSLLIKSPQQASITFNLTGSSPVRLRNLFHVRFQSTYLDSSFGIDSLGFLLKAATLPQIQPVTEELNQYNKKRQVHTGYKHQPVRLTFYDTADSKALQMFALYAKHFFGDFRHDKTQDYRYDVTMSEFFDTGNRGYGFAPGGDSDAAKDQNSQFFFDRIDIYQVFNGQYVQHALINPKISSFDPEDLDYASSEVGLITCQVSYEAVYYVNDGKPQSISSDPYLSEAFKKPNLAGIGIPNLGGGPEPRNAGGTVSPTQTPAPTVVQPTSPQPVYLTDPMGNITGMTTDAPAQKPAISSSPLAAYGNYNFGDGAIQSPMGDALYSGANNPQVAAINKNPTNTRGENSSQILNNPYTTSTPINQNKLDATKAAIEAAGGPAAGSLTTPVLQSSKSSNTTSTDLVTDSKGIKVAPQTLNATNAKLPAGVWFGVNRDV